MEPGTEQIREAKLKNGFEHSTNTPGILEELKELRGKSQNNLTRSLVNPRVGLTLVRVPDFSDRPIKLRAHLPVTEYHPVSRKDGEVVSLEPDPDSTSVSHSSC